MTQTRNAEEKTSFLRSLRAVGSFLSDPVPEEVVDDVLRVARWSGRDAARDLLGVPPEKTVRTAISLGYPDESSSRPRKGPKAARKPLSEIVHEERYG